MKGEWINDIDQSWTLFLDRDGVINRKLEGYVMSPDQLDILPGVLEALYMLKDRFYKIVVVTNQQGIGCEFMTHYELGLVHGKLIHAVADAHAQIDNIYYSPDLAFMDSSTRKPAPGMALQAQSDFPFIEFHKSIIVGDSQSDIDFGDRLDMKTVWIANDQLCEGYDLGVKDLLQFAKLVVSSK